MYIDKFTLKFIQKGTGSKIAELFSTKKNKMLEITLLNIKVYYVATII